jgi:peptide chain release factor 1
MALEALQTTRKRRRVALERIARLHHRWRRRQPNSVRDEIAGTGGEEAALFAGDLFNMYKRHAESKGWKVEIMEVSHSDMGGFKEIIMAFEGEGVFRELQFESGGHRVQRVPETEAQGRIHTSAATVAVMAEPEDVEINLKSDEYRIDKFCASGPGGQHVNKTESAIRLTHYETGIVVQCQDEKSQHKNLAKALRVRKSRIVTRNAKSKAKNGRPTEDADRLGDRSERIRTYNFPQNRLTDHRINLTLYKLDSIVNGNLSPVTDALFEYERDQLRRRHGGNGVTQPETWTVGKLLMDDRSPASTNRKVRVWTRSPDWHLHVAANVFELYTAFEEEPPEEIKVRFRELVKKRSQGEPVAYLVGNKSSSPSTSKSPAIA